jgi:hypothetical protein
MRAAEERNNVFVLVAFDTLASGRDYAAAQRFWSPDHVQHSTHIPPDRGGLFNLLKAPAGQMLRERADHRRRRLRDAARPVVQHRTAGQQEHRAPARRANRRHHPPTGQTRCRPR